MPVETRSMGRDCVVRDRIVRGLIEPNTVAHDTIAHDAPTHSGQSWPTDQDASPRCVRGKYAKRSRSHDARVIDDDSLAIA